MPRVTVSGCSFDIDLIVFDKDGTLIELDVWGHQLEKWGRLLQKEVGLPDSAIHQLYEQLGYDAKQKILKPDTPIVVASIEQILTIGAFILHNQGLSWTTAEETVQTAANASLSAPPEPSMIQMIGDVPGSINRLRKHDIRIGIATSDERRSTEKTIDILGIHSLIDCIVCADDPIPMKPAPDGLLHIGNQVGIPPERMLMVGDSTGDMVCGRAAGVAGCIRIDSKRVDTADIADVAIATIDEITTE